jgi:hypothetical protein
MHLFFRIFFLYLMLIAVVLPSSTGDASGQQIEIPRISRMPDFPQPFLMRNWKAVARGYDSLVFNYDLTGQHLPLVFFRENTVNYPDHTSFGLHTAVGTSFPFSGEAINAIPALVGATLAGIDKSSQFGHNWASMTREYFNRRSGENIYLNHPVTSSGHDWWYETMPNVFFMQLKYLYPEISVFSEQLPVMANQWMKALRAMGASDAPWSVPYMNYRAWSMETMSPLDEGVRQPEAAGAIAWILYNAYVSTGERDYLKGAEWALEFLSGWEENPSYELQLPYGVYTAARMNAEIGTRYDIEKMVNWCFDRGDLRGWGAIAGTWGGYDVYGLIGEANDDGNDYAFMMNGFQQAGALVPMVRYDQRFAGSIARWVLNMANASRLFYPAYMPADMQDNPEWAQTYDPGSYIAYEALRETKHGHSPYATGDAIEGGWAQTNLMLYGSSHVGVLAAVTDTTNVEGILRLDLLKTDFYRNQAYPTYLYYNPYEGEESVDLYLPPGNHKLYNTIDHQIIMESQSGMATFSLPPGGVAMLVVVPQDEQITIRGLQTLAGEVIIDYNNGLSPGDTPPRIKALAGTDTIVAAGAVISIYCTATDREDQELTYRWYLSGSEFVAGEEVEFIAPQEEGAFTIACKVTNVDGLSDSLSIIIEVVERIPHPPVIHDIKADPRKSRPGDVITLFCDATDYYDETLEFSWNVSAGEISGTGELVSYTVPDAEGDYYISCLVSNPVGLYAVDSVRIMVRDYPADPPGNRVAFYRFRGNANDDSGNDLHGTPGGGIVWTADMNDRENHAAHFNGNTAFILLPESEMLNFSEALSVSMFIRVKEFTAFEQHPVSHGSWEHRYKISVTGERFRFTVNTGNGIMDLDSETRLEAGRWYHVAAVYNGRDMEIWLDARLDAFVNHSGAINQSPVNLVFGQNLPGNNDFNFFGDIAMAGIFDFGLAPGQIKEDLILDIPSSPLPASRSDLLLFPNPTGRGSIKAIFDARGKITWQIFDIHGRLISGNAVNFRDQAGIPLEIKFPSRLSPGFYTIRIYAEGRILSASFLVVQ